MENQESLNNKENTFTENSVKEVPTPGELSVKNDREPMKGLSDRNVEKSDGVAEHDTTDVFPRKVVEDLRKEAAKYRDRAKKVDALEQRLHEALVELDGRLADPNDLPFHVEHLEDPEALTAAIGALVAKNPRMKAMRPAGDVGQGDRGPAKATNYSMLSAIRGY